MWLFRKKGPPYTLEGEPKLAYTEVISYKLFDCTRNSDKAQFSVFEIRADTSSLGQALVQNAVKRWKTLRHPAIPLFVEMYEHDNASYVVTEKLLPFRESELSKNELRWAIYTLTEFVSFLGGDAHGTHGNLRPEALFMTLGHELKVGGLHWLTLQNEGPIFENWSAFAANTKFAEPRPHEGSPDWAIDVRYIGGYLSEWEGKLPQVISRFGRRWIPKVPNPIAPKVLLESEYWQKDRFVQYLVFLRDLPLKDPMQREACFKQIMENISNFSIAMQTHAILPALVSALSFAQSQSIIDLMMAIGKSIDKDEFGKVVVPELIPLFKSKERTIRMALLAHMEKILSLLPKDVINNEIFPSVVVGLSDSSVPLRAATVISMCPTAQYLTPQHMRSLLIELKRLQKDNDQSIRCNSVICITKIAEYIEPEVRNANLTQCFATAAADSFPQTRKAAIAGFKTCQQYFNQTVIAATVMPALCPLCVDPSFDVKVAALKAMKAYIDLLSEGVVEEAPKQEVQKPPKPETKPEPIEEPDLEEDEGWPEEWSDEPEPEPPAPPKTKRDEPLQKQETHPKPTVKHEPIQKLEAHAKPAPMKLHPAAEKPQTRSKKPTISRMDSNWDDFDWDDPDE